MYSNEYQKINLVKSEKLLTFVVQNRNANKRNTETERKRQVLGGQTTAYPEGCTNATIDN